MFGATSLLSLPAPPPPSLHSGLHRLPPSSIPPLRSSLPAPLLHPSTQVFTACCVSFAHGSNDVANSIGPFSAIYTTYQTYAVPSGTTPTEKWIFVFGGVGIVVS